MMDEQTRIGVRRWAVKQAVFMVLVAAIIGLSAGTLRWWQGWALWLTLLLTAVIEAVVFLPTKPGLLAERSQRGENTERWDRIITPIAVLLLPIATWIVAGLDHRSGWSAPLPLTATIIAIITWVLSTGLLIWAMAANVFFSGTARIQEGRDHKVMTGGPYAIIRHPGYLASVLFYLATPIALGSWWAFIPTILAIGLLILRTALEDRMLIQKLPGYADYAQKTRFRLFPGIW